MKVKTSPSLKLTRYVDVVLESLILLLPCWLLRSLYGQLAINLLMC